MPVYSFALTVNGVDVTSFGLYLEELRGNWDAPTETFDEAIIPGMDGTIATTLEPTVEPRDFVVVGNLTAANPSAFETAIDALKLALSSAPLLLIAGNQTARQRTGVYTGMTTVINPSAASARVEIRMRCRNPFAYATSTTTVTGGASTDVVAAQGTYRAWPVITVTSATNPTITYKNSAGATVHTLSITGSGTIVIDCALKTVTVAGTRDDNALTTGDFFALDPRDGVYGVSSPTVRTSSGSLSATYRKAYR